MTDLLCTADALDMTGALDMLCDSLDMPTDDLDAS